MAQIIRVKIKFLEELTNVRTSRPVELEQPRPHYRDGMCELCWCEEYDELLQE
jgi:hypothetical protein